MNTEPPDPIWPEWVIRQTHACVFVQAPTPEAAVETAARKVGHMGGWRVGPAVQQEVFARSEYRDHAEPSDYTRCVIIAPEKLAARRAQGGRERHDHPSGIGM